MHARFIVIGGGLSGLAAAIRLARFKENVLLLERHSRVGGLNSYYYRHNRLIETGLHAVTNFAKRSAKHAPLNRLLRQLKIRREEIGFHEQCGSEVRFSGKTLRFTNNFEELEESVRDGFGSEIDGFRRLVADLEAVDPFRITPFQSTRQFLASRLNDPLLIEMVLCPTCYYGSSVANDIDFNQFVIIFRALFQEGLFRPSGSIKDFLDLLVDRYREFGGTLRLKTAVTGVIRDGDTVKGVCLDNGEVITCDQVISTIGLAETKRLLGEPPAPADSSRLAFSESIFVVDQAARAFLPTDITCLFFNDGETFSYEQPHEAVDYRSGAISLPFNFKDLTSPGETVEVRSTHLANYHLWRTASADPQTYRDLKDRCVAESRRLVETKIGSFTKHLRFYDAFTPLTIERFTGKHQGAIYGSPQKVKNGFIGLNNLFLAGTDQGFLGIVGSMLSGVTIVNQQLLLADKTSR